jgi:hypothetical protein
VRREHRRDPRDLRARMFFAPGTVEEIIELGGGQRTPL